MSEYQNAAQQAALDRLTMRIAECRICDVQRIPVRHSASAMFRGNGRLGMVVGIQPGNTEVESSEAFSGAAGTRLVKWLIEAGIGPDREAIFNRMYFTSLAKCGSSNTHTAALIRNCRLFLARQIEIVEPKVLITLGAGPLEHLFPGSELESCVGHLFKEAELRPTMFPLLDEAARILPLPHPSPLSRWLNEPANKKKLTQALEALRMYVGEHRNA